MMRERIRQFLLWIAPTGPMLVLMLTITAAIATTHIILSDTDYKTRTEDGVIKHDLTNYPHSTTFNAPDGAQWHGLYTELLPSAIDTTTAGLERVTVYPNPAGTHITILTLNGGVAGLYDVAGRRVMRFEVKPGQHRQPLSLPAGVYFLRVAQVDTKVVVIK